MIKWAKVTTATPFRVTFLGEAIESSMTYKKPSTYSPAIGDMVAFIVDAHGSYVCLGKFN